MQDFSNHLEDSFLLSSDERDRVESRYSSIHDQWSTTYRSQFRRFLETYGVNSEGAQEDFSGYYEKAVLHMARYGLRYIKIDLQHIFDWPEGTRLALLIQGYCLALWKLLDSEVDAFVKRTLKRYFELQQTDLHPTLNPSAYMCQWERLETEDSQSQMIGENTHSRVVQDMTAYDKVSFYVLFHFASHPHSVRSLRCDFLGQLINLRGTTTRLSDVRPELRLATFECAQCHMVIEDVEQQFKFTEPQGCSNTECKNRTSWILCPESCQFSDWQKMRLQENSSEIPAGSMPRVMDAILTRALCDRCKPGDKVILTGCLAAVPDVPSLMRPGELPKSVQLERNRAARRTDAGGLDQGVVGLRKLGVRDLQYRLVFLVMNLQIANTGLTLEDEKNSQGATDDWMTTKYRNTETIESVMSSLGVPEDLQKTFYDIAQSNDTLERLSTSVAPEVFGCEIVKKGILTLLVGGVEKNTDKDNMKLRGDINICIVGDPGTAKSQLLKYVHQFAGRSVYAAGNTSTAAGLTVSIHKDSEQGDVVIEAGALMLSDKGVCCIDEFDKMDGKDIVAIHEAMEQQTISICKAGIQATLNARASILAACNPRHGRYDLTKTFRQNVRLSSPILSRFDLFFTVLDSVDRDALVAQHVVNLHMGNVSHTLMQETHPYPVLSKDDLRMYLSISRSRRPSLTIASKKVLVDTYVTLRAESAQSYHRSASRVTVRQLESLIRLSEAIAKLKFSNVVLPLHVHEARRLIYASLLRIQKGAVVLDDESSQDTGDDQNPEEAPSELNKNTPSSKKKMPSSIHTIDADEYEAIAGTLIDHMRLLELDLKADQKTQDNEQPLNAIEAVVAKDDLISWYIEHCSEPTLAKDEQMEQLYTKIHKVIHRMVNRDFTLIEEERDMYVMSSEDVGESHVERVVALRLHPNLALDQPTNYQPDDTHHATLTTNFFNDEHQGMAESSSWAVNDEDLIDYMYGWPNAS